MEDIRDHEQKPLINELTLGMELVKQLRVHLDHSSPNGEMLIKKILSSYENAFLMLNWSGSDGESQTSGPTIGSVIASPAPLESGRRDVYKKRKALPRWTEQVRVSAGTPLEGSLDDGYSWRKYGQKDILGATHPRGYYRCTHRTFQGCMATKQVQRNDDDPSIIEITYRGKHVCVQASQRTRTLRPLNNIIDQEQNQNVQEEPKQRQPQPHELLSNFQTHLKVKTENLDTRELAPSASFSFPSTTPIECTESKDPIFLNNSFMGSYSPQFLSPATSETNYYSTMNSFGGPPNFQTSDSDLNEILSATTSASNSPIMDLDFLDPSNFDSIFPLDASIFLN
ncbi:hypothetical protein GIB67_006384 [Kingdonia uniflora]|uniref:WRKY domain-containing protein n=1 Tax=Kingdonia uniflora TaxID=39325 RepID=A0A7J7P1F6_9MAGN|nr:hypothetical protein GIB67_006384 [Kingdonia uniflora]